MVQRCADSVADGKRPVVAGDNMLSPRDIKALITSPDAPFAAPFVNIGARRDGVATSAGPSDAIERFLRDRLGSEEGPQALAWVLGQPEVSVHRPLHLNDVPGALLRLVSGRRWRSPRSTIVTIPNTWYEEFGREPPRRRHVP